MIRYYLSPIVGIGTEADPRRPVTADIAGPGVNWVCAVGAGPWVLVLVNASEAVHARLRADTRHWAFPRLFAPLGAELPEETTRPAIFRRKSEEMRRYLDHPIDILIRPALASKLLAELVLDVSAATHVRQVVATIMEKIDRPGIDPEQLWILE